MIDIGDQLPQFDLPRDGGGTLSLADLQGQAVGLFFYPRDNTSGCTKESIGFSEAQDTFRNLGVAVVGASKDSVKSHDKFVEKQNLTVPLLSDENGTLCEDCGVWQEKKMAGNTYMGIVRTTILTDKDHKIVQIWRKVKVADHVETVLEAAKSL
jgi:peroxiredoxin Q/BCP